MFIQVKILNSIYFNFLIAIQVSTEMRRIIIPYHEFGIVEDIYIEQNFNNYSPQKFNCISVNDDIINDLYEHLSIMKTFYHSLDRPEFGLANWGITIIPTQSLSLFYDVVASSKIFKKSIELNELAAKINQAKEERKYMIHYGI